MAPDTHVARHFVEELNQLTQRLLTMELLVEDRIRLAVRALVDRDASLTHTVIEGDREINRFQVAIDDRALKLLALHQPMAVDLRSILAAVKINTDLERVGDLAVNIAEATGRYLEHPHGASVLGGIPQTAQLARAMLHDALDSYVSRDTLAAQKVLDRDDALDAVDTTVFRDLLDCMLQNANMTGPALNLVLVARHLERVGDHATNIAEDVLVHHRTPRLHRKLRASARIGVLVNGTEIASSVEHRRVDVRPKDPAMKRREIKFVAGTLRLAPDRIETATPTLRRSARAAATRAVASRAKRRHPTPAGRKR